MNASQNGSATPTAEQQERWDRKVKEAEEAVGYVIVGAGDLQQLANKVNFFVVFGGFDPVGGFEQVISPGSALEPGSVAVTYHQTIYKAPKRKPSEETLQFQNELKEKLDSINASLERLAHPLFQINAPTISTDLSPEDAEAAAKYLRAVEKALQCRISSNP
jgi:hypothetical protein